MPDTTDTNAQTVYPTETPYSDTRLRIESMLIASRLHGASSDNDALVDRAKAIYEFVTSSPDEG